MPLESKAEDQITLGDVGNFAAEIEPEQPASIFLSTQIEAAFRAAVASARFETGFSPLLIRPKLADGVGLRARPRQPFRVPARVPLEVNIGCQGTPSSVELSDNVHVVIAQKVQICGAILWENGLFWVHAREIIFRGAALRFSGNTQSQFRFQAEHIVLEQTSFLTVRGQNSLDQQNRGSPTVAFDADKFTAFPEAKFHLFSGGSSYQSGPSTRILMHESEFDHPATGP